MFYFHIGLFKYFNKGAIRVITYSSLKIKFFRMLLYCIFFLFLLLKMHGLANFWVDEPN